MSQSFCLKYSTIDYILGLWVNMSYSTIWKIWMTVDSNNNSINEILCMYNCHVLVVHIFFYQRKTRLSICRHWSQVAFYSELVVSFLVFKVCLFHSNVFHQFSSTSAFSYPKSWFFHKSVVTLHILEFPSSYEKWLNVFSFHWSLFLIFWQTVLFYSPTHSLIFTPLFSPPTHKL